MRIIQPIDPSLGDSGFLGKALQATQNVISITLGECENVAQDVSFVLYCGTDPSNLKPAEFFNAESGAVEPVTLDLASGASTGVLRFKDISLGEYFQLKLEAGGYSGTLGNLKINY